MKAVVLEIRDGYAAVLREDGTVEKIRRNCRVGETIELEDPAKVARLPGKGAKWVAAAAAALVILSAGGTWGFNNAYAYSYVTLDANPSIEYVLNRRNRVIAVEALNEDAESIVDGFSGKGMSLTDAMAETTDRLYEAEYLVGEDDSVLVNITSRGAAQQETLTQEVDAFFAARAEETLTVYVTNATRDERETAAELGISAGRYMVLRDLLNSPETMTASEHDRFDGASVDTLLEANGLRPQRNDAAAPGDPAAAPSTQVRPTDVPAQADAPAEPSAEPESGAPQAAPAEDFAIGGGGPSGEPSM